MHLVEQFQKHSKMLYICPFSYRCDEYVTNDTQCGMLERVRQSCYQPVDTGSTENNGTVDDDQGSWKSECLTKEIQENVRTLRPRSRKRYIAYI